MLLNQSLKIGPKKRHKKSESCCCTMWLRLCIDKPTVELRRARLVELLTLSSVLDGNCHFV